MSDKLKTEWDKLKEELQAEIAEDRKRIFWEAVGNIAVWVIVGLTIWFTLP